MKYKVTLNGKIYEVEVEKGEAVIAKEYEAALPQAAPAPSAPVSGEKVVSPFPGLIKSFAVKEGDTVKKNQTILVLEAMKMDNDISAPCDGKISFKTAVGNNVETGAILAVIG